MIYYITSPTYKEVISSTIKDNEQLILSGCEEGEDILLYSYIKNNNATTFSAIDTIVIDLCACCDVDEKLVEALEMLKMTSSEMKIILIASLRHPGDVFLTKCFQMAIYDIICTDDFLEIRQELDYCLKYGKQYKDSLQFKEMSKEQTIVKTEIKQTVNKVMIAMAGSQLRMGVTHNAIVLANWLRKKGYMVALAECNMHKSFKQIAENMDARRSEDGSYPLNGIDFYPEVEADTLGTILGKSYNFIICDYGVFKNCDRISFNKAEVRIIITGAKAWEIDYVSEIFQIVANAETLKGYHYCFNLVPQIYQSDVKSGMGDLKRVHFLKYTENPYLAFDFSDAEEILKEYMPLKVSQNEKKSLFSKIGIGGKSKNGG